MRRSRWLSLAMVLVLLASTAALVGAGPPPGRPTPVVVSIRGVAQVQGRDVIVEVIVVVPRGADPNEVALAALREQGGRPFESDEFTTTGLVWDQFSDDIADNDFVTQYYNPADDPTAGSLGKIALTESHGTWTGVATSQFAFKYGGDTDRCPSLVQECRGRQRFDDNNDVAWLELGPNILGVTWFSTSIDEADMALSTRYDWFTDGSEFDVETVFLHENGHVVGLGHSEVLAAVMYPYYPGVRQLLHQDDIDGITLLYPAAGNQAPVADAGPDQTALVGELVTFDGSGSYDIDGTIDSYDWDFGDGNTGSGETTSHLYAAAGEYTVELTVTDDDAATDTDEVIISVLAVGEPGDTMHVGDLDGSKKPVGKSGKWAVSVTVTIHDESQYPVANATVSGTWSGATTGSVSGTTGSEGTVAFTTGPMKVFTEVTFTVDAVTHDTLTYDFTANHDEVDDDESDGTSITVTN